jgi:hypothetical protein
MDLALRKCVEVFACGAESALETRLMARLLAIEECPSAAIFGMATPQ